MKKHNNQETKSTISLHLWTYERAIKAVPYLRTIVGSLRESWLTLLRARLQLRRMNARPGRPDRRDLMSLAETAREVEHAQEELDETLHELNALDVYSLDPTRGLALMPFARGGDLAWYVFDLFAPQGLDAWRFHADPLDTRRPLADRLDPALSPQLSVAAVDVLMSQAAQAGQ